MILIDTRKPRVDEVLKAIKKELVCVCVCVCVCVKLSNQTVVVQAFNSSTQEAEAGGSLSLKLAWSTEQVSGQPGLLHRETLS